LSLEKELKSNMSIESKIDALRIKLANALNWLDIPGVDSQHLQNVANKCYRNRSQFDNKENTLVCAIEGACRALALLNFASPTEIQTINEQIIELRRNVDSLEQALKFISPSRIDVISSCLK